MRTLNFERCIKNALRAQPDFCSNRAEPERPDTAKTSLAKPSRAEPEPGPQPELTKPGQAERSRSQDKPSWAEPGRAGLRFFFSRPAAPISDFFHGQGHILCAGTALGALCRAGPNRFFFTASCQAEPSRSRQAEPGRAGPGRPEPGQAGPG
jgi:hypothetical protein